MNDLKHWARETAERLTDNNWYAIEDAVSEGVGYSSVERCYEPEECATLLAHVRELAVGLTVLQKRVAIASITYPNIGGPFRSVPDMPPWAGRWRGHFFDGTPLFGAVLRALESRNGDGA